MIVKQIKLLYLTPKVKDSSVTYLGFGYSTFSLTVYGNQCRRPHFLEHGKAGFSI